MPVHTRRVGDRAGRCLAVAAEGPLTAVSEYGALRHLTSTGGTHRGAVLRPDDVHECVERGWIEWSADHSTAAITEAGRAVLAEYRLDLQELEALLALADVIDVSVRYRRDGPFPEDAFLDLLAELKLRPRSVSHKLLDGGGAIELGASLRGPSGSQTRQLAERLCGDPRILGFEIDPRNP